MFDVRPTTYDIVKQLRNKALKDYVIIDNNPRNKWFGAFANNKLVGCGATLNIGRVVRMKGLYVVNEYRRKGIATALITFRYELEKGKTFSLFATDQSLRIYKKMFDVFLEKPKAVNVDGKTIIITFIKFSSYV